MHRLQEIDRLFKYCSKSLVIKYAYQIITRTMELNCVELDFNKRFVFNAFLESHRYSRFLNIKTKYKHFIKFRYSLIIFCMEAFSIVPNMSYVKTNELKSLERRQHIGLYYVCKKSMSCNNLFRPSNML